MHTQGFPALHPFTGPCSPPLQSQCQVQVLQGAQLTGELQHPDNTITWVSLLHTPCSHQDQFP